ncbi:MAG: hypothetical protein Q8P89_01210 [bacterium]|nr:hypothetical protein [bacterium]
MPNSDLIGYINLELKEGKDEQTIRTALLNIGWGQFDIDQAFLSLRPATALLTAIPTNPPPLKNRAPVAIQSLLSPEPPVVPQNKFENPMKLVPRVPRDPGGQPPEVEPSSLSTATPADTPDKKETTIPASYDSVAFENKSVGLKKLIFTLVGIVALLAMIITPSYYYLNQQKTAMQELTKKQIGNFTQLEGIYNGIITGIKDVGGKKTDSQLLRIPDQSKLTDNQSGTASAVLGALEESPEVEKMRKLGELYNRGGKAVEEIHELTNTVESKSQALPFILFAPKGNDLWAKTSEFTDSQRQIVAYFEKTNQIQIKFLTGVFDLFVALGNLKTAGYDASAFKNLDNKIKAIDEVQKQYSEIEISSLPEEIRQSHRKNSELIDQFKEAVQSLSNALKNLDEQAFESAVSNLITIFSQDASQEEIETVEMVSFWKDQPIRETQEIKNTWEKFNQNLLEASVFKLPQ